MMLRSGMRGIHQSSRLREKTVIPEVVLSELNNTVKLATHNKQKQIFLHPKQIVDRRYDKIISEYRLNHKLKGSIRQPTNLLLEDKKIFFPISTTSVDDFKPSSLTISQNKRDQLQASLIQSFTAKQLGDYLTYHYIQPKYAHLKKSTKNSKAILARYIIRDVWEVTISDEAKLDDLLVKSSIPLNKTDLFLLLSENGFIIQYLSRVGVKISFDSNGIQFIGTESQVRNAEVMLNSIMLQATRETLDLSYIKKLFLEKYHEFSITKVIKNTEVYFEHVSNDIYDLLTLNSNQIKRAKRLLVWLLNYNQHIHQELILSHHEPHRADLVPYKDDESLAWNKRSDQLFKLQNDYNTLNNQFFQTDLQKFSEDFENSIDFDSYKRQLDQAKSSSNEKLEQESWDLLSKMGILQEKNHTSKPEEPIVIQQQEKLTIQEKTGFDEQQIQSMYSKLTDFQYRKKLFGQSDSNLNPPIFTLTLGNILFEGLPDSPTKLPYPNSKSKYQFNSNIPFINDKVLSLPLYHNQDLSIQDRNLLLNNDPHNYAVQLKFLPSPYEKHSVKHMKYPPVELWVDLNDKSTPDIETLNVVTVEGENNLFVSLKDSKADMKVCCQLSGNLLTDDLKEISTDPVIEFLKDSNDIENLLESTSKRYSKFKSQPGIGKFLQQSKLDFSGKSATSIHPHIDIKINGETVRYHYINLSYRRQLELALGERLIQFNIVEGGSLGGRRIEINMIGDLEGDISIDEFKSLLTDARTLLVSL